MVLNRIVKKFPKRFLRQKKGHITYFGKCKLNFEISDVSLFFMCFFGFHKNKKVRNSNLTCFLTHGIFLVEVVKMTITKLKAKNQITIPSAIVKRLHLKLDELFAVDVEDNFIKLVPVKVEPRYTAEELKAIDNIVGQEKGKAKVIKAGKEFSQYIKKITK